MGDTFGEKRWIAIDLAVQVAGVLIMALSPKVTWLVFGYLLCGFFSNMEMPAIQSLVVKLIPAGGRGLAFSLSFIPYTLLRVVSPVLGALIVGTWRIWEFFLFSLVVLFVAMLFLGFLRNTGKKREPN